MSWSHSALVAELYDIDQPLGRSVGDVEWYTLALSGVQGRILEPACGTGRVLIPLLERGHDAEGLDHSPDMLEICRAHCRERDLDPVLYLADMTSFVKPERYAAIIMPRGSIRNVEGREATRRTVECFRRSLVPGGRLLVDVTIPQMADVTGMVEHWRRDPFVYTRHTMVNEYDPALNCTLRYARYEKWHDGELLMTELHRFVLQHWNQPEFAALLEEVGFTDVSVRADFTEGKAPGPGTRYWSFRAVRP
jgi:SAM-dependent methyltransferase